jgi:hypothetical protein
MSIILTCHIYVDNKQNAYPIFQIVGIYTYSKCMVSFCWRNTANMDQRRSYFPTTAKCQSPGHVVYADIEKTSDISLTLNWMNICASAYYHYRMNYKLTTLLTSNSIFLGKILCQYWHKTNN